MAVCPGLCWSSVTLSSTAREGEGGEGKRRGGKKWLTAKNKSNTMKSNFPLFYYLLLSFVFVFFFLFGNSGISGEISAAFDSSTCGLGIRTSLSYVWVLATRQTTTHVNNILHWVMTWWIMKVSHERDFQHQQWPNKNHLDDVVRRCTAPWSAKLADL